MAKSKVSGIRKVSEVTGVYRARITSKGQVTIPAAVREQLGLRTGDEIDFEPKSLRFSAAPRPRLSELYGILAPEHPRTDAEFDWKRDREMAAEAAGRHDAEKTAKIMKRLKL
jgi:AbrB family looped-hinge helix DNA binding protein